MQTPDAVVGVRAGCLLGARATQFSRRAPANAAQHPAPQEAHRRALNDLLRALLLALMHIVDL